MHLHGGDGGGGGGGASGGDGGGGEQSLGHTLWDGDEKVREKEKRKKKGVG